MFYSELLQKGITVSTVLLQQIAVYALQQDIAKTTAIKCKSICNTLLYSLKLQLSNCKYVLVTLYLKHTLIMHYKGIYNAL